MSVQDIIAESVHNWKKKDRGFWFFPSELFSRLGISNLECPDFFGIRKSGRTEIEVRSDTDGGFLQSSKCRVLSVWLHASIHNSWGFSFWANASQPRCSGLLILNKMELVIGVHGHIWAVMLEPPWLECSLPFPFCITSGKVHMQSIQLSVFSLVTSLNMITVLNRKKKTLTEHT